MSWIIILHLRYIEISEINGFVKALGKKCHNTYGPSFSSLDTAMLHCLRDFKCSVIEDYACDKSNYLLCEKNNVVNLAGDRHLSSCIYIAPEKGIYIVEMRNVKKVYFWETAIESIY